MGDTLEIPHSFIGFAHSPAGVKPVKPGKSPVTPSQDAQLRDFEVRPKWRLEDGVFRRGGDRLMDYGCPGEDGGVRSTVQRAVSIFKL